MVTEITSAKIGVIGAGLMGHSIAQIFLAAGHKVSLFDPSAEVRAAAPDSIQKIFALLEQDATLLENLSLQATLADTVADADVVFEAGPEKLEVKQQIFSELAEHAKADAILATNTSAIPIGEIGAKVSDQGRVVGTHFWNPPHLVKLVEVVQSATTREAVVETTINLLASIKMMPVHVKHDIPGFIGNRLQHAMKREAIALVAAGVCDAETIDTVVKHSFGSRLAVLGPLEQSDLVGLDLTDNISKVLYPSLDNTNQSPEYLVNKIEKGELGMRTGKGFREWTPEAAQEVRDRMTKFLAKQTKESTDQ